MRAKAESLLRVNAIKFCPAGLTYCPRAEHQGYAERHRHNDSFGVDCGQPSEFDSLTAKYVFSPYWLDIRLIIYNIKHAARKGGEV
jgi:hypothetical protein